MPYSEFEAATEGNAIASAPYAIYCAQNILAGLQIAVLTGGFAQLLNVTHGRKTEQSFVLPAEV